MAGDEAEFVSDLTFNPISETDIPKAFAIETESYPADEAATLEAFTRRQSQAPDLFLGAYIQDSAAAATADDIKDRILIGYICATLSSSPTLTHSSMSTHDPNGTSVCIHSVCVAPTYRRRGVATRLLKEYLSRLQKAQSSKYDRVLLIAHEDLRSLYEGAGFEWVGPSAVVHGTRPWFEMQKLLDDFRPTGSNLQAVEEEAPTSIPPDIMQALQASLASSSRRPRPTARLLSEHAPLDEVLTVTQETNGTKTNKHDLLCPRPDCGSIILKLGAGRLVDQEIANQEVLGSQSQSPSANVPCWIVEPNPMAFENIGFSKSVPQSTEGSSPITTRQLSTLCVYSSDVEQNSYSSGPKMKFLLCADCDHGSLGWTFEGETRYWVICSRVGYKVQDV